MTKHADVMRLWEDVVAGREVLRIHGRFALTKGSAGEGFGVFLRDAELERRTLRWLAATAGSQRDLLASFARPGEPFPRWPTHLAARTVATAGVLASGENVFIIFPASLAEPAADCPEFEIEFLDSWEAALREVMFPCVRRMLKAKSGCDLALGLGPDIPVVIFGVAVLHELGHQIGFFRMLPERDGRNRSDDFLGGVLSEMYADCAVAGALASQVAAAVFIFLYRVFWFGRRGALDGPERLNGDTDCLIGAYLWERARREGLLAGHPADAAPYTLRVEQLPQFFAAVRAEVDDLGERIAGLGSGEEQTAAVRGWLARFVPWEEGAGRFAVPADLLQMCEACRNVPENPDAPQRGRVSMAEAGAQSISVSMAAGEPSRLVASESC